LIWFVQAGAWPNRRKRTRWLLIKRREDYANPSWQMEDAALDRTVQTGRTMKEIKQGRTAKTRVKG
jgi:bifunctional non-homologous end joining protein LigD